MKNAIMKFLVSRLGGILTPIIAGLVGAGVAKLAAMDAALAGTVDQVAVTGFVLAAIMSALNAWTNRGLSEGVKVIQEDIGAEVDGVPGPKTQGTVRDAVIRAGHPGRR